MLGGPDSTNNTTKLKINALIWARLRAIFFLQPRAGHGPFSLAEALPVEATIAIIPAATVLQKWKAV